jgi:hypothetical protein
MQMAPMSWMGDFHLHSAVRLERAVLMILLLSAASRHDLALEQVLVLET